MIGRVLFRLRRVKASTVAAAVGWGVGVAFGAWYFFARLAFFDGNLAALRYDAADHFYFHAYTLIIAPAFMGLFGWHMGRLLDDVRRQKKRIEAHALVLANQSMTDDVTGIYNHRHIVEEVEREIARARRHRRGLCGIMIDVDDFKRINDRYGHLTGDVVLRELAYVIHSNVRSVDIVGRYGGDEFIVILPETEYEPARDVAERIHRALRDHPFCVRKDVRVNVTASLGLLLFKDVRELGAAEFLQDVDDAMQRAKRGGKDRVLSMQAQMTPLPQPESEPPQVV